MLPVATIFAGDLRSREKCWTTRSFPKKSSIINRLKTTRTLSSDAVIAKRMWHLTTKTNIVRTLHGANQVMMEAIKMAGFALTLTKIRRMDSTSVHLKGVPAVPGQPLISMSWIKTALFISEICRRERLALTMWGLSVVHQVSKFKIILRLRFSIQNGNRTSSQSKLQWQN